MSSVAISRLTHMVADFQGHHAMEHAPHVKLSASLLASNRRFDCSSKLKLLRLRAGLEFCSCCLR